MANPEHVAWLKEGVESWNERQRHYFEPNLAGADLHGWDLQDVSLEYADLRGADLGDANLSRAYLHGANFTDANLGGAVLEEAQLTMADLCGANLRGATLYGASFMMADLSGAKLVGADLREANFFSARLRDTDLSGAVLERAALVKTNLEGADLTGCRVYGVSAWDLSVDERTTQANLVITPEEQPDVIVDNLKVAQFVYLLIANPEVRDVIDTLTTRTVLILGRFTDDRKVVLDALREELRRRGYVPILFDFAKPVSRDLTETVSTLAHLARFVVADLTDAKSLPQELSHIVPFLPSVPVQPLMLAGQRAYGMFEHFTRYPWVLPTYLYRDEETLLSTLDERVLSPAEAMARELLQPRPGTT